MNKGLAAAFVAYFLFSSADACIKALGGHLPVFEILFFIMVAHFLTLGAAKPANERWREALVVHRPKLVFLRAVFGTVAGLLNVYAFTRLPLSEAYALIFLLPAFVTVLSIPILGEQVGWRRWFAVAIGLVGVILVVRPGFRELNLGHLAALASAVCGAGTMIVLRVLGPTESRITLLTVAYTMAVVVNGILMIPGFVPPQLRDFAFIAYVGLAGGTGQILMIVSMKLAPASQVVSIQYTQIIWAVVFGAIFFGDWPDGVALAGMVLVGLSGLITVLREGQIHGWSRRFLLLINRPDEV